MKEITTSKGVFKVFDMDYKFTKINQWYKDNVDLIKLSSITEQQASDIVDYPIVLEDIQGGGKMETYYNYKLGRYDYGSSLLLSLYSLLDEYNIEINENTYIFKV